MKHISDEMLHDMMLNEKAYFDGLGNRRRSYMKGKKFNDIHDMLVHYSDMEDRSLKVYQMMEEELYRRENEKKEPQACTPTTQR